MKTKGVRLVKNAGRGMNIYDVIYHYKKPDETRLGTIQKLERFGPQNTKVILWASIPQRGYREEHRMKNEAMERVLRSDAGKRGEFFKGVTL